MSPQSTFFADLPPKIIVKVLLKLPYPSLLVVQQLSRKFRDIIQQDPQLEVSLFKKMSKVYVEPVDNSKLRGGILRIDEANSEPVRLHPALPIVDYVLMLPADSAVLWNKRTSTEIRLLDLAISNDFISIPVVTLLKIHVHDPSLDTGYMMPGEDVSFNVVVKNPKGVRLGDFFRKLDAASNIKVDDLFRRGMLFGDQVHYDGLHEMKRKGLSLTGRILLSNSHERK
uniref:F-box domain-containing protein n=1 Tax=Mycena chlorophos TaxID=658473 RepID=A0ABQ0LMR4_MYCCL|nr:predicted protein [Mycena chlorophos]